MISVNYYWPATTDRRAGGDLSIDSDVIMATIHIVLTMLERLQTMASNSDYGKQLRLWQATQTMASNSDYGKQLRLCQATQTMASNSDYGKQL